MPSLRKAALAICIPLFVGQQGRHHAVRQFGRQQMTSHVLVLCHVSSRYVNRGSSSQGHQYHGTGCMTVGCMTVLSVSSVPRYWMPDNIHVHPPTEYATIFDCNACWTGTDRIRHNLRLQRMLDRDRSRGPNVDISVNSINVL